MDRPSSPLPQQAGSGQTVRLIGWVTGLYLVLGIVGLQLAIPPSTASPLFPAAGFALATVLSFGRPAVVGTFLGQFCMHLVRCWLEGKGWPTVDLLLGLVFAIGAAGQAAAAAALVRRTTGESWRELAFERQLFGFLIIGGGVACLISATVGAVALGLAGFVAPADLPYEGWKWYVGDTLGVFIFTPLTLVLLAGSAGAWRTDNRRVILKMLVIFALVLVAYAGAGRWEQTARLRQLSQDGQRAADRIADQLSLVVSRLQLSGRLLAADETQQHAEGARQLFDEAGEVVLVAVVPVVESGAESPLFVMRPGWLPAAGLAETVLAVAAQAASGPLTARDDCLLARGGPGRATEQATGLLLAVAADDRAGGPQPSAGWLVVGIDHRTLLRQATTGLPEGVVIDAGGVRRAVAAEPALADGVGLIRWSGTVPLAWLDWQVELKADQRYLKGSFDATWLVAILSLVFAALFADRDVALLAAVSREEVAHQAKQRIERELAIARDIQQGLLPRQPPLVAGFELAGCSRPADQTGGDFYDFYPLADGRLAVAIADVTGHGLGPALVAAEVRALFRAAVSRGQPLGAAVAVMHQLLADDLPPERLVTACFAVLTPAGDAVEYLSTGHGPLLVCRAATGDVEELPSQGLPFGFLEQPGGESAAIVRLAPGDLFVLVTDGLFEAADAAGSPFGLAAVHEVLRQHRHEPAERLVGAMERALAIHLDRTPRQDDLTVVVIKRAAAEQLATGGDADRV